MSSFRRWWLLVIVPSPRPVCLAAAELCWASSSAAINEPIEGTRKDTDKMLMIQWQQHPFSCRCDSAF